jgi:hypothetical protein
LILQVNRGNATRLELLDGALYINCIAISGVCVADERDIDRRCNSMCVGRQ